MKESLGDISAASALNPCHSQRIRSARPAPAQRPSSAHVTAHHSAHVEIFEERRVGVVRCDAARNPVAPLPANVFELPHLRYAPLNPLYEDLQELVGNFKGRTYQRRSAQCGVHCE